MALTFKKMANGNVIYTDITAGFTRSLVENYEVDVLGDYVYIKNELSGEQIYQILYSDVNQVDSPGGGLLTPITSAQQLFSELSTHVFFRTV